MPHGREYLNEKQAAVLRWVQAGAPAGAFGHGDFAHRITARGLANRGLIRIKGQGETWTAEITDKGRKRFADIGEEPSRAAGETATARLFRQVAEAGGSLRINEEDKTDYRSLVDNSLRSPSRPHGQKLETRSEGQWFRARIVEVYLTEFTRDLIQPKPVPIAARIRNPHPVVDAFKSNPDASYVSRASMGRAARVYDALAKEATRRGYEALERGAFLRGHQGSLAAGHLVISAFGSHFPIAVMEISGAGGAKLEYPAKHKQPRWVQNRGYEFVPTGKLEVRLDGPGTPYQGQRLRETKGREIDALLPEVFVTIEVAGQESVRVAERRQRDLETRQEAWDRADEAARAAHRDAQIRLVIQERAGAWKQDQELVAFLAAIEARMPSMNLEQQAAAARWLLHGRKNVAGASMLDELGPIHYYPPKSGELRPYLQGFTEQRPQ